MKWEDVRVFISSTFNDMHAERDYIIKNVFPQLEEWCERRQINFNSIDLRWGIPNIPETEGSIIYKCLTGVDDCRPFFLCFLGQRRGWVPKPEDISQSTFDIFRGIEEMVRNRTHSATEFEIEHASLMPLAHYENEVLKQEEPAKNAVFLRRKDDYIKDLTDCQKKVFLDWDDEISKTDSECKDYRRKCKEANDRTCKRIAEKYFVIDYACRWDKTIVSPELKTEDKNDDKAQGRLTDFHINARDIPDDLRKSLAETLKSEFPEIALDGDRWKLKDYLLATFVLKFLPYARTELQGKGRCERDLYEQKLFMSNCCLDVVERPEEIQTITEYCYGDIPKPFVIRAESGIGKTSLLAQFADQYQGKTVSARFLGTSELSGALLPLWDSILSECHLPSVPDLKTLQSRLPSLLSEMAPRVLIFDGIEQIPDGAQLFELFSIPLPSDLKVIFSVGSGKCGEELARSLAFHKDYPTLTLPPFSDAQKRALIEKALSKVLKALTKEQTDYICGLQESGNPLFLSVFLNDIRSFGSFEHLESEIRRYGSTPLSAFDAMLKRMETDYLFDMLSPSVCVPLVFGLLGYARDGLSSEELAACLSEYFPDAARDQCMGSVQICLRQARPFLCRRDGRTDFRHQAFRTAARTSYATRENEFHHTLKNLFRNRCDPQNDGSYSGKDQRALREYAFHLSRLSAEDHVKLFSDVCYISARCRGTYTRDLIREYEDGSLSSLSSYSGLLLRFRDSLEKYDNVFPSLLWAYGSEKEKTGFERLRCSWIKAESVVPDDAEADSKSTEKQVRVLADTRHSSAAFCFADGKPLAFACTLRGQITAYDAMTMLPLSNPIYAAKAQPLGLCASDQYVAAAFDNDSIEIYRYEADENSLFSSTVTNLTYLTPLYCGAVMCFDNKGRLWYQTDDSEISCYDISSHRQKRYTVDGAEELSAICAYGKRIYGTACLGRGTLLFCIDADGNAITRDLGNGDSRVLCADEKGCLVSCAAKGSAYPLILVNNMLKNIKKDTLHSPITAALSLAQGYLLLPSKQPIKQIWLWNGVSLVEFEQELLYQDQAMLCVLPDQSMGMISAGAVTRFAFSQKKPTGAAVIQAPKSPSLSELPDLRRYEVRDIVIYSNGDYACAAGVSESMRSVQNEQCAGAVFMKRNYRGWQVCGEATWGRALEIVRTACVDPESGRFTLLFRSAEGLDTMLAVQGTAQELSRGHSYQKELALPQDKTIICCFSDGMIYYCANTLLLAYDACTLDYLTGLQLKMPATDIFPFEKGIMIQSNEQSIKINLQGG